MQASGKSSRDMLAWYVAMGVDEAIAETPTDWALLSGDEPKGHARAAPAPTPPAAAPSAPRMRPAAVADEADEFDAPHRRAEPPPLMRPPQPTAPRPAAAALAPDEAVGTAREVAARAQTLDALEAALRAFDGCGLKATATNLCFYRGAAQAPLMIIGEAPGRDEDIAGKPFVGRAGQLLDRMLSAIGLDEASVHITNIVYWRPPGNRTPTPQEAAVCAPFLERQIELVAPRVILCVGGAAAKHVLDTPEGIMRLRGKWRETATGARSVPTMATLHPAYLLRTPAAKRMAWRDLLEVRARLDQERLVRS